MSKIEDRLLYFNSPEVYAAVHAIADIAQRFHEAGGKTNDTARENLLDALITFFAQYDRMRTDEVESLKARLQKALQHAVIPMKTGSVK